MLAVGGSWKKLSEGATPAALVVLSHVVEVLDHCVELAVCFKVETIGSEFMAVSGLPAASPQPRNTAHCILRAALAMLEEVAAAGMRDVRCRVGRTGCRYAAEACASLLGTPMQVRLQIGMDTGTVVETILGRALLPRWKLFGDTVNTASRCACAPQAARAGVPQCERLAHV